MKYSVGTVSGVALSLAILFLSLPDVRAGSATWNLNPTNGDWFTASNWTPATIPNDQDDTATFGLSNVTDITIGSITLVRGMVFAAGASAYTITLPNPNQLYIGGGGVTNDSGLVQDIATGLATRESNPFITFGGRATAGINVVYTNQGSSGRSIGGSQISFFGRSRGGRATFINKGETFEDNVGGGHLLLAGDSTAERAVIVNEGGAAPGSGGGKTTFAENSTADRAEITAEGGLAANSYGGSVNFLDVALAGQSVVTLNGAQAASAQNYGGTLNFFESSSGEDGTFTANGGLGPLANGGYIFIRENATGGEGNFIVNSGTNGGTAGRLDLSNHFAPGVAVGSIAGDGLVCLGGLTLTVGANERSATFSGVIQDGGSYGGTGGSLNKIGAGVLTLSGANTYSGTTTVGAGTLKVANDTGSATGTGTVSVSVGTFGGEGIVAGAVKIGTGSGSGATLAPSVASSEPAVLTIKSTVTFKADGIYAWRLNSKKVKADQVVAAGLVLESGAQFQLEVIANQRLPIGQSFVAINNTSGTVITGTFTNLPEGTVLIVGKNSFQVSYTGGDGNDLTLTVVP